MGTGKTQVAKALAAKLGMKYLSTDKIIEKKEGMKISDIFAEKGEPHFRKAEKEAVRSASSEEGAVIDAGGGAVIDPENVKNLKKNGVMVCLCADPDLILKRTSPSAERPLLNTEKPEDAIKRLLSERKEFYARAEHHINTSKLSVEAVVSEIEKIINNA